VPSGLEDHPFGGLSDKLSSSWNRPKAAQPAAGEQLEQYLPMA
jgi:hypothetical protein